MNWFERHNKLNIVIRTISLLIIAIVLITLAISCTSIRNNYLSHYLTYTYDDLSDNNIPVFSFEYPSQYHIETFFNSGFEYHFERSIDPKVLARLDTKTLGVVKSSITGKDSSWIALDIYTPTIFLIIPSDNYTAVRNFVISTKITNATHYEEQDIVDTPVFIDKIPAHQISLSIPYIPAIAQMTHTQSHEMRICTFFIHDGYLWIISWGALDSTATLPPSYFTRLLDTFKITEYTYTPEKYDFPPDSPVYLTFRNDVGLPWGLPDFSFEYPEGFQVKKEINQDFTRVLEKGDRSKIRVVVSTAKTTTWQSKSYLPTDEERLKSYLYSDIVELSYINQYNLNASIFTTTISGLPAKWTTCTVTSNNSLTFNWGTGTGVLFEHKGVIFFISWVERATITDHPPAYFAHLLESFKFLEK